MKQGLIKILFLNGDQHVVEIAVPDDQDFHVQLHEQWVDVKQWWLIGDRPVVFVTWGDGSEILLARDKILSISMTPKEKPLEIV